MRTKTRLNTTFLFFYSLLTFGQTIKADSIKYYYIVQSDTTWTEPDLKKYSGKFIKKSRQFYTLKKTEFKTRFDSLSRRITLPHDTFFVKESSDYPLVEGFYSNGVKTGKWKYIHDYGTDYSWCTQLYYDYYLTYKQDSIIKEVYSINGTLREAWNSDSTFISGYLERISEETIRFECLKSKNQCLFWVKNKKNILETTGFNNFASTLKEIENGDYDRKIKIYR